MRCGSGSVQSGIIQLLDGDTTLVLSLFFFSGSSPVARCCPPSNLTTHKTISLKRRHVSPLALTLTPYPYPSLSFLPSLIYMARATTWHPLPSDSTMNPTDPTHSSRPDISRWELTALSRDRLMSVDPSSSSSMSHPNHGATFLHPHFDQSIDPHPPHSANQLSVHTFDNDKMDVSEQSSYDIFSHPSQPPLPHQRFRSNTSPAAPSYGPNSEPIYSGIFSHDSVPSFHSQNAGSFDMISSMSSSLTSSKGTPLTPSDSISGLQFSAAGPQGGIKQDITDLMSERRPSAITSNNTFQSDLHDDFTLGVTPHTNFAPSNLPPFSDRLPRFPSDTFLSQSQLHGQPPDQLRGVPPQATHTRFEGAHYDDIPGYLIPNPQNDLTLRIPTVEDTMMRIRMGQMGASTDFHTFIRLEQDVSGCLFFFSELMTP